MKTNQYLARQGILSGMLALLEVATTETREQVQRVLEDITDLSSDEDSPTVNTGGTPGCHELEAFHNHCHSFRAWGSNNELVWLRHGGLEVFWR